MKFAVMTTGISNSENQKLHLLKTQMRLTIRLTEELHQL